MLPCGAPIYTIPNSGTVCENEVYTNLPKKCHLYSPVRFPVRTEEKKTKTRKKKQAKMYLNKDRDNNLFSKPFMMFYVGSTIRSTILISDPIWYL